MQADLHTELQSEPQIKLDWDAVSEACPVTRAIEDNGHLRLG
jgi:hypothetical protein